LKRESHRLAGAAPGRRILDVGCGLGDDAAALAGRVAPGGTVVGVDGSQAMLAEARRRHGGGENLSFELANAAHLRTQRAGRMSYAPPTARATSSARTPASWCAGRERRAALRQPDRAAT
jgi:trans-aconitate methyltransferase